MISKYESTFYSDLVMSFLLDKLNKKFVCNKLLSCDVSGECEILITKKKHLANVLEKYMQIFQIEIDRR